MNIKPDPKRTRIPPNYSSYTTPCMRDSLHTKLLCNFF